ncbi:MAG: RHS repeat-associated core domain-containing protein [Eubacteriales bacterium]
MKVIAICNFQTEIVKWLLFRSADHDRTYYHYASDERGLVTHITQGENVLNEYEYDAWGEVVHSVEKVKNRFKFNGQQLDPITGQYYLRARFYNPVIARFTQEDIYRGDGLNLYAYCHNNPTYYADPTGNACETKGELYAKLRQEGTPAHVAYQQSFGKDPLKPNLSFTDLMSAEDRVRYTKWVDSNQPIRPVADTPNLPDRPSTETRYSNIHDREIVISNLGNQIRDVDMTNHGNPTRHPEFPHVHGRR